MSDPIPPAPAPASEPAVSSLPGPFAAGGFVAPAPVEETVTSPPPPLPPAPVSQPPAPRVGWPAPAAAPAPDAKRPQPVMSAARQAGYIAGLVGAVGTALGAYGAISGQHWAVDSAAIVAAIATALAGGMPIVTALGARAQVTPLASPQGVDGAPLVPASRP